MKVYVMDNGGQWTHREWRVLRDLGIDTEIRRNDSPIESISDADALVLSGGAPSITYESFKLGNTGLYLDQLKIPILGICIGAQYIGMHYGGKVGPAAHPEFGRVQITVANKGSLLDGIPDEFYAWESHNDEVKEIPDGFELLASSSTCPIQAFSNDDTKRYGIQFHPEVEHTQFGEKIFRNFVELCVR
ncbi:MAG: GMP synthase subunit A [Candidatus Thermoplasmatota archaeon]|jgi:GMP synthase (glutamine-hydrolysing)|nr:GMP synthase subunit A [Candidatus Thermoplasmatota archaeon]